MVRTQTSRLPARSALALHDGLKQNAPQVAFGDGGSNPIAIGSRRIRIARPRHGHVMNPMGKVIEYMRPRRGARKPVGGATRAGEPTTIPTPRAAGSIAQLGRGRATDSASRSEALVASRPGSELGIDVGDPRFDHQRNKGENVFIVVDGSGRARWGSTLSRGKSGSRPLTISDRPCPEIARHTVARHEALQKGMDIPDELGQRIVRWRQPAGRAERRRGFGTAMTPRIGVQATGAGPSGATNGWVANVTRRFAIDSRDLSIGAGGCKASPDMGTRKPRCRETMDDHRTGDA